MTLHSIEVRAISEQHDVQAHKLIHEILQLSTHRLPSLSSLSDFPLSIRTASLYSIWGQLDPVQQDRLIKQLLVDPIIQEAAINEITNPTHHIVDVFFHAGVTDTLAESVLAGVKFRLPTSTNGWLGPIYRVLVTFRLPTRTL